MSNWKLQPAADLDLSLADRAGSLARETSLMETLGHPTGKVGRKSPAARRKPWKLSPGAPRNLIRH